MRAIFFRFQIIHQLLVIAPCNRVNELLISLFKKLFLVTGSLTIFLSPVVTFFIGEIKQRNSQRTNFCIRMIDKIIFIYLLGSSSYLVPKSIYQPDNIRVIQ